MIVAAVNYLDKPFILENLSSKMKLHKLADKYNIQYEDIIDIFKEFGIDFKQDVFLDKLSTLASDGISTKDITKYIKEPETTINFFIKKSYQIKEQMAWNDYYARLRNKYGEKLVDVVKSFNLQTIPSPPLPNQLFERYNVGELLDMGISMKLIRSRFRTLKRTGPEDISILRTHKNSHVKDYPEIRERYENDLTIKISQLSREYNIPYIKLRYIKEKFHWKKINFDYKSLLEQKIKKLYEQDCMSIIEISNKLQITIIETINILKMVSDLKFEDIPSLFKDGQLSLHYIATVYNLEIPQVRNIISNKLGTIPLSYDRFIPDMDIDTWTEFQIEFLKSGLTDKELAQFIHKPLAIIQAKREDIRKGKFKRRKIK